MKKPRMTGVQMSHLGVLAMGAVGHLRNWRGWLPLSLKT